MNRKIALTGLLLMFTLSLIFGEQITLGSKELNEALSQISSSSEKINVYVIMRERFDSDRLYNEVILLNKNERRERTISVLKDFSVRTQESLRKEIEILIGKKENK